MYMYVNHYWLSVRNRTTRNICICIYVCVFMYANRYWNSLHTYIHKYDWYLPSGYCTGSSCTCSLQIVSTYIHTYIHMFEAYRHGIAQAAAAPTRGKLSPHLATAEKLFWSGHARAVHSTYIAMIYWPASVMCDVCWDSTYMSTCVYVLYVSHVLPIVVTCKCHVWRIFSQWMHE